MVDTLEGGVVLCTGVCCSPGEGDEYLVQREITSDVICVGRISLVLFFCKHVLQLEVCSVVRQDGIQ